MLREPTGFHPCNRGVVRRTTAAICLACAAGAGVAALIELRSKQDAEVTSTRLSPERAARTVPVNGRPRGVVVDCSMRSEANFPGAFTDRRHLVVGPLVLIGGGEPTPAEVVWEFGGNKFPLLVKAGHRVTVRLPASTRRFAGLAYGPQPPGRTRLRNAHRAITFDACPPGKPSATYQRDGPSGSSADGVSVTFWAGFVLTRRPACLPLEVQVDGERAARRAVLNLGERRC
jgi:hypothetical protein